MWSILLCSENPSVSKPDQVFQVETPYVGIATGLNEGEPVVKPSVAGQQIGRKMLQVTVPSTIPGTVHLTGSGVSAGDSDLGAQANLYGQAESNGVTDTHVEVGGILQYTAYQISKKIILLQLLSSQVQAALVELNRDQQQ